jgi:hypothetical protein
MSEKSSCRSQLGRMLRMILEIRTKRFPNAGNLAEACEVSRRTIYRDLDALIAGGVPVNYRADRRGYEIGSGFFLEPTRLEEEEVLALAIRAALPVLPLAAEAHTGLAKIVQSLPEASRGRCLKLLAALEIPMVPIASPLFFELLNLLAAGKPIRVVEAADEALGTPHTVILLKDGRLSYGGEGWLLTGRGLKPGAEELRIQVSHIVRVGPEGRWPVDSEAPLIRIPTAFDERAHSSVG